MVLEAVGAVPVPDPALSTETRALAWKCELAGSARERHPALRRRQVEHDVADRGAAVPGRDDDVGVQHAAPGAAR